MAHHILFNLLLSVQFMLETKLTWSEISSKKPKEQYDDILVCSLDKNLSSVGYFDGCSFKLWGRVNGLTHKDITHWAEIPKPK